MAGVGRNDPCPCGSGRKYKNCCLGKLPRNQIVCIGYRQPFEGVTFEKDETFVILSPGKKVKADAVFSQTQYTRKSGKDKVLSRVPDKATLDLPTTLASFDAIFAIDTNTKQINDDAVSISCIWECYAKMVEAEQKIKISHGKVGNLCFKNCPDNMSERIAWFRLARLIHSNPKYKTNQKIAIITDHDLSNHPHYNSKKLPIYDDFYLPDNIKLLYASSDADSANIFNMLIKKCDKDAANNLAQLEKSGAVTMGNTTIKVDEILTVPRRNID